MASETYKVQAENVRSVERMLRNAISQLQAARRKMNQINDMEATEGLTRSFTANHFNVVEEADAALTKVDMVFFQ